MFDLCLDGRLEALKSGDVSGVAGFPVEVLVTAITEL